MMSSATQGLGATPPRLITFEGIDGAGKSSHLEAFAERLRARGHQVLVTREPGGPALAERLRELLLSTTMSAETEVLLAFAARREHLLQTIEPALVDGIWVVCDRFTDSTFAYQGAGRGVDSEVLAGLEAFVQRGRSPDLTLLFDLPAAQAAERRARARAADRFEAEDAAFFERVRGGYLSRVAQDPDRFRVIDANRPLDAIRLEIDMLADSL